jgi:hypothetical protein
MLFPSSPFGLRRAGRGFRFRIWECGWGIERDVYDFGFLDFGEMLGSREARKHGDGEELHGCAWIIDVVPFELISVGYRSHKPVTLNP